MIENITDQVGIERVEINHPMLPYFNTSTEKVYRTLAEIKGLGIIAALSGHFKTGFMCNLAANAMMDGQKVLWASLEMDHARIMNRLRSILADIPAGRVNEHGLQLSQDDAARLIHATNLIKQQFLFVDHITNAATASTLTAEIQSAISQGVGLILVDGTETLADKGMKAAEIASLLKNLSALATSSNATIWCTSQCTRSASNTEFVSEVQLAYTSEKEQRAAVVMTMGWVVQGTLWTVSFPKMREPLAGLDRVVYRFFLRPSLRFEVFENPAYRDIDQLRPIFANDITMIGPDSDLPDMEPEENMDGDAGETHHGNVCMPSVKNADGFVPIHRELWNRAMVRNMDCPHVNWLLDLYRMAHYESCPMNAPGTYIKVTVGRGQYLASLNMLKKHWKTTTKRVRSFLNAAERSGAITCTHIYADFKAPGTGKGTAIGTAGNPLGTLITLCDYVGSEFAEEYAEGHNEENGHRKGHSKGHRRGTGRAQEGHTT